MHWKGDIWTWGHVTKPIDGMLIMVTEEENTEKGITY